eukprot:gene25126-30663_t
MTSEEASEDALVQQLDKHLQTRKKLQNGGDLAICPANFQYRKVTLNQILAENERAYEHGRDLLDPEQVRELIYDMYMAPFTFPWYSRLLASTPSARKLYAQVLAEDFQFKALSQTMDRFEYFDLIFTSYKNFSASSAVASNVLAETLQSLRDLLKESFVALAIVQLLIGIWMSYQVFQT